MIPAFQCSSATSRSAAEQIQGQVGRLQAIVYQAIFASADFGRTRDELEQALEMKHQTINPRLRELEQKGLIVDSGRVRLTRADREAVVWVITERIQALPMPEKLKPSPAELRRAVDALTDIWHTTKGLGFTDELVRVVQWLNKGAPCRAK